VHARVRKIIKTRGHFPTDEAATKLIWLALRHITPIGRNRSTTGKRP
jgi:putative transposase